MRCDGGSPRASGTLQRGLNHLRSPGNLPGGSGAWLRLEQLVKVPRPVGGSWKAFPRSAESATLPLFAPCPPCSSPRHRRTLVGAAHLPGFRSRAAHPFCTRTPGLALSSALPHPSSEKQQPAPRLPGCREVPRTPLPSPSLGVVLAFVRPHGDKVR